MAAIQRTCSPGRRAVIAAAGVAALLTTPVRAQALLRLPMPMLPPTPLADALARRRSVRGYAPSALTIEQLSSLLWAAQGVTAPGGRRTAPSAGALYPLELYLHAPRVEQVAPGIHRYDAAAHALHLVGRATTTRALADAAGAQRPVADAPLIVAVTAVNARTAAKYGARTDRYVAFESGAAAQNLALAAVALGLGAVVIGAFDDRALAGALGLPPGTQPIALMAVGRP